jgi:hypothetical protein
MAKRESSKARSSIVERLKDELGQRGYILRLTTERMDGENLMAKVEILDLNTKEVYVKVVGIGKLIDTELALGFHVSESLLPELLTKGLMVVEGLKAVLPPVAEKKG